MDAIQDNKQRVIKKSFVQTNNKLNTSRLIIIPEGITEIGKGAFENFTNLQTLIVPKTVKIIGEEAFKGCVNLKDVTLPIGIETIKDKAFSDCQSLEKISLPTSLSTIGRGIFAHCKNLKSVIFANSNINYSFQNGFELSNNSLTYFDSFINKELNITVPEGVLTIGKGAFYNCNKIVVITLPKSVVALENGAFANCSELSIIDIPNSVINFGRGVFAGCTQLMPIKIYNRMTSYSFSNGVEIHDKCLTFFDETINKERDIKISNNVYAIGQYAFYNCKNISTVILPSSLKMIENGAFALSTVTNIAIPEGIRTIEKYTFYKCQKLQKVFLPESLKNIEKYAFARSSLLNLDIPNGVTSIHKWAFHKCIIEDINIPTGLYVNSDKQKIKNGRSYFELTPL